MRKLIIFDLDQTVIDSGHRYAVLSNGDIDLPYWRQHSTPKLIARDKLLPMAKFMRAQFAITGNMVAICTARIMSIWDWKFLRDNDLPFHFAMHRLDNINTKDAILKKQQILKLAADLKLSPSQFSKIEIYDDNPTVLDMAEKLGIKPFCSVQFNNAKLSS